jgi:general secretion pathway protein G
MAALKLGGKIMKKRDSGFTLIELLIVIAIIGILAAIAIPNLLAAVQRGRQKKSMSDARAIATAIESYAVDYNEYPASDCSTPVALFTGETSVPLTTAANMVTALQPSYMSKIPLTDGWGSPFRYAVATDGSQYRLESYGRDNTKDGTWICATTHTFNDDILYANGTFIQWPEGSQN